MGIKGLTKLLYKYASRAVQESTMNSFFGRKIAIDASTAIYQFLIAVRFGTDGQQLTDKNGEVTSHLIGLFYRCIKMIQRGIKPVWVFDGAPPDIKSDELDKRRKRREEAEKELEIAKEKGDIELTTKLSKRTVHSSRKHNDECKKLLRLMGVPVVQAPCEAEAQCAVLCKAGKVWGVGSEDYDTLAFGSPILLKHLTASESKKLPIKEFDLRKVLEDFSLTMDQFIDMCILCGSDFTDKIKGIGPHRAFELITKFGSIENVIKNLDTNKYPIPQNFDFVKARKFFQNPLVTNPDEIEIKFREPDEEGLIKFLVEEKGFDEKRVRNGVRKLRKEFNKPTQMRLDSFLNHSKNPRITKEEAEAEAEEEVEIEVEAEAGDEELALGDYSKGRIAQKEEVASELLIHKIKKIQKEKEKP